MKNIETNSDLLSEPIFQQPSKDAYQSGCVSWIVESVVFPDGTEFRGKYKGYFYYGKVRNGTLALDEKELCIDEGDAEGTAGNGNATGKVQGR